MRYCLRPATRSTRRITIFHGRAAGLSLVLIIALIVALNRIQVTASGGDESETIRIGILSKQLRLVAEGDSTGLVLRPEKGSVCLDGAGNPLRDGSEIVLSRIGERWKATMGRHRFEAPFELKVEGPPGVEGVVAVPLKDGTRRYPLPLGITCIDKNPRIHIREKIERYAVDSARAEFGPTAGDEHEAVMALAHVIMTRCRYRGARPRHKGYDVCDMTHCQIYRGRTSPAIRFDDQWHIDPRSLKGNLFFHSRCGGYTLGEIVFGTAGGHGGRGSRGVPDRLYRQGVVLCEGKNNYWERSIDGEALLGIFGGEEAPLEAGGDTISYDKTMRTVTLRFPGGLKSYPVETFRLMINRVRGWNFIRSNNFDVMEIKEGHGRRYIFKGRGLGHGAGLCQHGALALSRRGYNRFEILEHYYGDLDLITSDTTARSPYLSYCVFDLASGECITAEPGYTFLARRVPPGSVFKLIVAFYLAEGRDDIFRSYTYHCRGINHTDTSMPERCWHEKGHGTIRLPEALAHSCNLYFASLHSRISEKNFRDFFSRFCRCVKIEAKLPETKGKKEWSQMLAGLDFRIDFAISDYIKIVRFIASGGYSERGARCLPGVTPGEIATLRSALGGTFDVGTASGPLRTCGDDAAYTGIAQIEQMGRSSVPGMWGKTSTIIDGTNRALGYGLFIGGNATTGVVALLRKGNGHLAARWARELCRVRGGE